MHQAQTSTFSTIDYLTSRELPYQHWSNSIALFTPFANEPWAMMLDSAASDHINSRYDIIVRRPAQTLLQSFDDTPTPSPFDSLATALADVPSYDGKHPLPFCGGALGYFGYDAGRWQENITPAARALPLAAKSAPQHARQTAQSAQRDIAMPDIALGFYHHALIIDHKERKAYALGPEASLSDSALDSFWRPNSALGSSDFSLKGNWRSNMSHADYVRNIQHIKDHLNAGDCYQINLAQRFNAAYTGSEWEAYKALRQANQAPFSAFLCLPQGYVLSLSPERFLQTSANGKVQTKPIKGTRPRSKDPVEDKAQREALLQSSKDQAENLMIVDLLRNDLSRVCLPGSVKVPKLFAIESFAAVHHLVSTIEGQLPAPLDSIALLRASFPGGSITGAPKISAMSIIESLEPHRRSVYCGSIGYINQNGSSDTNIAIRTLVAHHQHLYCWAGGGIVIDSEAEAEYQETFDKVRQILPVLRDLNPSVIPLS